MMRFLPLAVLLIIPTSRLSAQQDASQAVYLAQESLIASYISYTDAYGTLSDLDARHEMLNANRDPDWGHYLDSAHVALTHMEYADLPSLENDLFVLGQLWGMMHDAYWDLDYELVLSTYDLFIDAEDAFTADMVAFQQHAISAAGSMDAYEAFVQ